MESSLPTASAPLRVLLAEESLPFRRLIREALVSFRGCQVDETPSAERAFEMALSRPYQLFIFALTLPDMSGILLDSLLSRAYPLAHPGSHTAPPVIFMVRGEDSATHPNLTRSARVRGVLPYPPKLDLLLSLTTGLLPDTLPPLPPILSPPAPPPNVP
ncbi:hypothetical protein GCM10023213_46840 [Prosthecobacter algae]|uniref:Response regulatory domain-containing protein n=1 Tax=Prosthecobacter algae TaxID=1144682 RepID=A0ABP9PMX9_9BACT